MPRIIEKRSETRLEHKSPVVIIEPTSGLSFRGRLVNYCTRGLYFETDCDLKPGAEIDIGIENSPFTDFSDIYDCYRTKIVWRKKIDQIFYSFGYAVQITSASKKNLLSNTEPNSDRMLPNSRLH